jgi:outer membrane protein insertion porin family
LGLRITVPAMGPAPIALDFAYAVSKADFDDTEIFSFSLGFSR